MVDEPIPENRAVPIRWITPEDIRGVYASNVVLQATPEGLHILSFFEAYPPMLIGEPAERRAVFEKIQHVEARCVARVIVTSEKLREISGIIATHFDLLEKATHAR